MAIRKYGTGEVLGSSQVEPDSAERQRARTAAGRVVRSREEPASVEDAIEESTEDDR
jgi:hypothetical protein